MAGVYAGIQNEGGTPPTKSKVDTHQKQYI